MTATAGIALTFAAADVAAPRRRTPPWPSPWSCWPSRSVGTWAGCGGSAGRDRRGRRGGEPSPAAVAMRQDERTPYDPALRTARMAAYPPGEFVGQESFMRAGEILSMARRAGIGPRVSVLDLCCGVAGPGRFVTAELGCNYLGVDRSAGAIELARERGTGLSCRFEVGEVPPVPTGRSTSSSCWRRCSPSRPRSRCSARSPRPWSPAGGSPSPWRRAGPSPTPRRRRCPAPEPSGRPAGDAGRPAGRRRAGRSLDAGVHPFPPVRRRRAGRRLRGRRSAIASALGDRAVDDLLAAHRLWSDWLRTGRVRKFAVVAEKDHGVVVRALNALRPDRSSR